MQKYLLQFLVHQELKRKITNIIHLIFEVGNPIIVLLNLVMKLQLKGKSFIYKLYFVRKTV